MARASELRTPLELTNPQIPATPPGNVVFEWIGNEAGTQQADWNAYRNSLATGAQGRPVGSNGIKHLMANGRTMHAIQNMEVPVMLAGGEPRRNT